MCELEWATQHQQHLHWSSAAAGSLVEPLGSEAAGEQLAEHERHVIPWRSRHSHLFEHILTSFLHKVEDGHEVELLLVTEAHSSAQVVDVVAHWRWHHNTHTHTHTHTACSDGNFFTPAAHGDRPWFRHGSRPSMGRIGLLLIIILKRQFYNL